MVEGQATVERVLDGVVWVRPAGPADCPRCAAGQGCGGGLMARMLPPRRDGVEVDTRVEGLRPGDAVVVGVDESVVTRAAGLAYGTPLVGLVGGGATAASLGLGEWAVTASALAGLAASIVWLRGRGSASGPAIGDRPVVLRRATDATGDCPRVD